MRQMKNSGIAWVGDIPQEWQCSKIGALFTENNHKNIFGKETKALQFNYGTIVPKKDFDSDDEYVARTILNYNIVDDGMIMLNGLNLNFDFVTKRVAIVRERGVITSAYMSFYPTDNTQLTSEYAHYLLKSYDHCSAFHNMGGGVRKILNFNELKRQPFILPPLNEQQRIADFLDKECAKIDGLKADIQAQIDTLEQYKRSVITEAVTRGLNSDAPMKDSGIAWVGETPEHWIRGKVKYAVDMVGSGTTPQSNVAEYYENGTINWIQSGDIYGKRLINAVSVKITETALVSSGALKIYKQPFIVMAMYGGSVGNIAISLIDACTNQACCCLKSNDNTDFKFLYYWLIFCKEDFLIKAEGGGQPNISQKKISNQVIYLPPTNEQKAIAEYLDSKCAEIEQTINDKKAQIETLDEYKKSLIYEYVTGKKEVVK